VNRGRGMRELRDKERRGEKRESKKNNKIWKVLKQINCEYEQR